VAYKLQSSPSQLEFIPFSIFSAQNSLKSGFADFFFPKWVEIGEVEPSTQKAILFLATREIRRHGSTVVEWLIFWSSLPVEEASR